MHTTPHLTKVFLRIHHLTYKIHIQVIKHIHLPPRRNSLALANEHRLATVAFPAISTGVYGYPVAEAAQV